MADRTNTDMLILEFLSVTKPSRRREVKEWLDALTKYDNSVFRARFRLWKLTVHLPSELVCHTVHLPSFCNIIRSVYGENLQKFTTSKYNYTYEWHCNGACWLQQALTRVPCRPAGPASQPMPKQLLPATVRDPGWHEWNPTMWSIILG